MIDKPIITRVWAMPSRWTFTIPPIKDLISKYVGDGKGWVDPFAGEASPAEITNDINPERKAGFCLDAHDFVRKLNGIKLNGVLFDPPYSLRQAKEVYENLGRKFSMRDGQIVGRWKELKDELAEKVIEKGIVISCGWNSEGFGKKRGYKLVELLLVAHGSGHNDTIVTVEQKQTINKRLW